MYQPDFLAFLHIFIIFVGCLKPENKNINIWDLQTYSRKFSALRPRET